MSLLPTAADPPPWGWLPAFVTSVYEQWHVLIGIVLIFAAVGDLWTRRSYHIAETLVVGLYPAPLASQALVDATKAWLDAHPDVPALRRLVTENLAGVERALAVQARDEGSGSE